VTLWKKSLQRIGYNRSLKKTQLVNIVIDTPHSAPFKLKFDEKYQVFRIHKAMPLGFVFPVHFGFLPSTQGGDGDPLDVLLLTDLVMPIGAVVAGRLIAVLEAEQEDRKRKQRNDRLIAIPIDLTTHQHFFLKYDELQGANFTRSVMPDGPARFIWYARPA
jgi:inorganic pyrophosphatase